MSVHGCILCKTCLRCAICGCTCPKERAPFVFGASVERRDGPEWPADHAAKLAAITAYVGAYQSRDDADAAFCVALEWATEQIRAASEALTAAGIPDDGRPLGERVKAAYEKGRQEGRMEQAKKQWRADFPKRVATMKSVLGPEDTTPTPLTQDDVEPVPGTEVVFIYDPGDHGPCHAAVKSVAGPWSLNRVALCGAEPYESPIPWCEDTNSQVCARCKDRIEKVDGAWRVKAAEPLREDGPIVRRRDTEEIPAEHRLDPVLRLSPEEYDKLMELCANPPAPTPALRALLAGRADEIGRRHGVDPESEATHYAPDGDPDIRDTSCGMRWKPDARVRWTDEPEDVKGCETCEEAAKKARDLRTSLAALDPDFLRMAFPSEPEPAEPSDIWPHDALVYCKFCHKTHAAKSGEKMCGGPGSWIAE